MDAPTGMELDSRNSNFGEKISIVFYSDSEYPFVVSNGIELLKCVSWSEACEIFEHFYAYERKEVA